MIKIKKVIPERISDPNMLSCIREIMTFNHLAPQTTMWVAYDESGEWAGFATTRQIDRDKLMFNSCYVKMKHRGKGLQKRFLKIRLQFAKRSGYKEVYSWFWNWNKASGNNLIQFGFKLCDIPEYYEPNPAHIWVKRKI
jgi:predicted GNAT family acetyltransferase